MKPLPKTTRLNRDYRAKSQLKQSLLDEKLVGVSLMQANAEEGQPPVFLKNYAPLSLFGDMAPKVFVHGRALFPNKDCWDRFHSGQMTDQEWENMVNPKLWEKISRLLGPEGLEERLTFYFIPQDRPGWINHLKHYISSQFPKADLSDIADATEETAVQQLHILMSRLEKIGGSGAKLMEQQQHPDRSMQEQLYALLEANAGVSFDRAVETMCGNDERSAKMMLMKDQVLAYAAKHRFDPEIYTNICLGLLVAPEEKDIHTLAQKGIHLRVNAVLQFLAKKIANPYDPALLEAENKIAESLAGSVQPRAIDYVLRKHISYVVTDDKDIKHCTDVVAFPADTMYGKFETLKHAKSTVFDDLIVLAAPKLSSNLLGLLARHETEHAIDMLHKAPFAQRFSSIGPELLAKDRRHLEQLHTLVRHIESHSNADDLRQVAQLGEALHHADAKNCQHDSVALMRLKADLLLCFDSVQERIHTVLPRENAHVHDAYSTQFAQLTEAPAVMEELKGVLGRRFVKDVLPGLYEACLHHRQTHPEFIQRGRN